MKHEKIMIENWIKGLNNFGVFEGPKGQPLESLTIDDLRCMILKEKLHRNLETLPSPWF